MIDKKEVLKAKRTLMQYCIDQQPDCSECIFSHWYDDGNGACEFTLYSHPIEWIGGAYDGNE